MRRWEKVPRRTGGKDLLTRQVHGFVACFKAAGRVGTNWEVYRASNESYPSDCCCISHTPPKIHTAVTITHITRTWRRTALTCSWLHTVLHTSGGVFWGNTSRQSQTSVRQSNFCKHSRRFLAGAAGTGKSTDRKKFWWVPLRAVIGQPNKLGYFQRQHLIENHVCWKHGIKNTSNRFA